MKKTAALRKIIPANCKSSDDYRREYEALSQQLKDLRQRLVTVSRDWAKSGLIGIEDAFRRSAA
jgi:hypothetical protein